MEIDMDVIIFYPFQLQEYDYRHCVVYIEVLNIFTTLSILVVI